MEEKTERLLSQNKNIEGQNEEIIKAKKEVEQRAKDMAAASRYKSEFLANMSHELRTPLNSLLILSENLSQNKKGNLDDKQIKSAQIINKGGHDLLKLINDILDLSKVEAGKLHVEIDKINVKQFAEEINLQFSPIVNQKGLTLNTSIGPDIPEFINTDSQRLSQIIKNLLSNALKFTEAGSVSLNIMADNEKDGFVKVSVVDSGIGIPADKLNSIFEAFQQADGSTSRQYGGTGLGLAISKAMAELLGGEITLTSVVGKGSEFTISIPMFLKAEDVEQATKSDDFVAHPVTETIPVKTVAQTIPAAPIQSIPVFIDDDRSTIDDRRLILIVEDDPEFAKILLTSARDNNYTGIVAGTGHSAKQMLDAYSPNAVVLDLGLPDMSGSLIIEYMRSSDKHLKTPVHVVSGSDADLSKHNVVSFLKKPAAMSDIDSIFAKLDIDCTTELKHILVVEDDESNQEAIKVLIAQDNIKITSAYTVKSAIEHIVANKFDCIILDLSLPDKTGIEMLDSLKESGTTCPPIIIYTGRSLSEDEHNHLKQYSDSVIVKGAEMPSRLLDEVSLFLNSVNESQPDKVAIEPTIESTSGFVGKKVLLVDDDMRNVFALSSVLEERGLDVIIACNGKVALEKLETELDINAVLMDIMMPVMDGYEAMKHIRSGEKYKDIPIIALTAKAMSGDREACMEAGATDYISKPIDVEQLFSMLKVWLFKS